MLTSKTTKEIHPSSSLTGFFSGTSKSTNSSNLDAIWFSANKEKRDRLLFENINFQNGVTSEIHPMIDSHTLRRGGSGLADIIGTQLRHRTERWNRRERNYSTMAPQIAKGSRGENSNTSEKYVHNIKRPGQSSVKKIEELGEIKKWRTIGKPKLMFIFELRSWTNDQIQTGFGKWQYCWSEKDGKLEKNRIARGRGHQWGKSIIGGDENKTLAECFNSSTLVGSHGPAENLDVRRKSGYTKPSFILLFPLQLIFPRHLRGLNPNSASLIHPSSQKILNPQISYELRPKS